MKAGKSSKSWRSKLEKPMEPKLVKIPESWTKRMGQGSMLIPTPLLIDKLVQKIPKGKIATVNIIREQLASDFRADVTCPLTTGIFLNIAANTAEEDKSKGEKKITPYWRVLKEKGKLNSKYPGGTEQQAQYLRQEGFHMVEGSKKDDLFVKDFENKLVEFD